jgi:predicted nucleotidyltransferase
MRTMSTVSSATWWRSATRQGRQLWSARARVRALARRAGVEGLLVFGSVARGDAGPDSDIDLLAESHTGHLDPEVLDRLAVELSALLGFPVDVACQLTMTATALRQAGREARRVF